MDGERFDPIQQARLVPDRVARGGVTRRTVLRLAVGGALGLGAQAAPEVFALTARPAFAAGWTHLAGTTTGLLCYRAGDGFAESGSVRDGLFLHGAFPPNFVGNWNRIIGANRSLFFYRASDSFAASGYLDATGVFVQPPGANYEFSIFNAGWTPFPGTRSGRYLWYRDATLEAHSLNAAGYEGRAGSGFYVSDRGNFGAGWTHMAGAGLNMYLAYRGDTGAAFTGRIEARPSGNNTELLWSPRGPYQFDTGWTHVVGTFNGGVLFYKRQTGQGATGFLDAFGNFTQTGSPVFGANWSHVVGAGSRGIIFYQKGSGKGIGGFLSIGGVWKQTTTYG